MTRRIPPDVAQRVEALLAGGAYSSPDEVLRSALSALESDREEHVRPEPKAPREAPLRPKKRKARRKRSLETWLADFRAWAESHPPVGHFVDDSRDSIYE